MAVFVKAYWKVILVFVLVGLVGGFFTGLFVLDSYPEAMRQDILAQGLTPELMGAITAVQAAGYGLVLGVLGILLSEATGLWKEEWKIEKQPLMEAILVSVVGGLVLILADVFIFGRYSDAIRDSYNTKPSMAFILGSVTYGAVIEEVMLRLFLMSALAWILHRLIQKDRPVPSESVLALANGISAMLFAAGHLPATQIMLGLTPMIVVRCFLLNGGIGLLFGRLYRKRGILYAMIAHGGCHMVSKLIWLFFL